MLTERVTRDGHHSGEVSFPGGKAEPDDADIDRDRAARSGRGGRARRPARPAVRVVGLLERFWIPVSDFEVTPVVALADRRPVLVACAGRGRPDRRAAGRPFLPDAPIAMVERTIRDWPLRYGAYDVDGLSVWGATARILSQLGAILGTISVRDPDVPMRY